MYRKIVWGATLQWRIWIQSTCTSSLRSNSMGLSTIQQNFYPFVERSPMDGQEIGTQLSEPKQDASSSYWRAEQPLYVQANGYHFPSGGSDHSPVYGRKLLVHVDCIHIRHCNVAPRTILRYMWGWHNYDQGWLYQHESLTAFYHYTCCHYCELNGLLKDFHLSPFCAI